MKREAVLVVALLALWTSPLAGQDADSYQRQCDSGEMMACTRLGVLYDTGRGVTQDLARASELFNKACDGGDTPACNRLAVMYDTGRGVPQDRTRATSLFCDSGDMQACGRLGAMYQTGSGVTQDLARADSLFQHACERGDMQSCVTPPRALSIVLPPRPPRDLDLMGTVSLVWIFVDEQGAVVADSTRLEPPTGDTDVNERLIREAAEWVFAPAQRQGKAVAAWYTYTITF